MIEIYCYYLKIKLYKLVQHKCNLPNNMSDIWLILENVKISLRSQKVYGVTLLNWLTLNSISDISCQVWWNANWMMIIS